MKRTPCKPGTIIGWYAFRATVVEDTGGRELVVKCNGRVMKWAWVYFVPCRVISVPRTRNNRLSTVFRNAALYHLDTAEVRFGRNYYSCHALKYAAHKSKQSFGRCKKLYIKYMKPEGKGDDDCWFDCDEENSDTQIHRGMCLLLMAEIVKDL